MKLSEKQRALKDLEKLEKIIKIFCSLGFDIKYPNVFEQVQNYQADAQHFYKNEDYYTSFGAANYAYGHIDAVLIIEGKKDDNIL